MPKFRAKPLLVRAERVSVSTNDHANEREAARLAGELQLDTGRITPGSLWGWVDFTNTTIENGHAREGQWIVLWPDGQLTEMTNEQFNLLFAPAAEIDPPEDV